MRRARLCTTSTLLSFQSSGKNIYTHIYLYVYIIIYTYTYIYMYVCVYVNMYAEIEN